MLTERPFDVRRVVLDIRAAQAAFGWSPAITLEDGIRRAWRAVSP